MLPDKIYWNGVRFPSQDEIPVAISKDELQECCYPDWVCNDEYGEYPGEINLFARYPYIDAPGGYYPYPNGVVCLGPFDVDIFIRHITNTDTSYDDLFLGGINDGTCINMPSLWSRYGPSDGSTLTTVLANPMPAGGVYRFTVVSMLPSKVGLFNQTPLVGNIAKITWATT